MRKFVLLLAFLLLGTTLLPAQVGTAYRYAKRWNISVFGGPSVYVGDFSSQFTKHYMTRELFSPVGGASVGYYFTSGNAMRILANYSKKSAILCPDYGFYPYKFKSVQVFGDYVLNFKGLAEYYTAVNSQGYVGLGGAYTYGFRTSWSDEALDAAIRRPNFVPAFHIGLIVEYVFPNGLGFLFDLCMANYLDPYDGQPYSNFPLDFETDASFGLIYHFKTNKKVLR